MPRRDRLDASGTLHHVIVRGIEKCRIVNDVADRKNFVKRLAKLSADTKTRIYGVSLAEVARRVGVSNLGISKVLKQVHR